MLAHCYLLDEAAQPVPSCHCQPRAGTLEGMVVAWIASCVTTLCEPMRSRMQCFVLHWVWPLMLRTLPPLVRVRCVEGWLQHSVMVAHNRLVGEGVLLL